MKKLLRFNLLTVSFVSMPLIISCSEHNKPTTSPYQDLIQEDYQINEIIKKFVKDNLKQDDPKRLKSFFNEQLRVEEKFKSELNMSLTFAPLFIPKIEEIAERWKLKTALNSVKIISSTLNDRWFWYLQNIGNFTYVFNNWMPNFKEHRAQYQEEYLKNQSSFEEYYTNQKTLSKTFKDYQIVEFSNSFSLWQNPTNKFFNHKITFLRLKNKQDHNILIPIFLFEKTNNSSQREIFLTGEIFTFQNTINNFEMLYQTLSSYISKGMEFYPQKELDYYQKLNSNNNFDPNPILSEFNDEYFLNHYHKNNYANAFYYANELFNKESPNNKMYRYTWGFIDEK